MLAVLHHLTLPDEEIATCKAAIEEAEKSRAETRNATYAQLTGRLGDLTARLNRLTDVYLEGAIGKEAHDERRADLIMERQSLSDSLSNLEQDQARRKELLLRCVELARRPEMLYESATTDEKRVLLKVLTLNRTVMGKDVAISTAEPFCFLASARENCSSALDRVRCRTLPDVEPVLCTQLLEWADGNPGRCAVLAKLLLDTNQDENAFSLAA